MPLVWRVVQINQLETGQPITFRLVNDATGNAISLTLPESPTTKAIPIGGVINSTFTPA